MAGKKGRSGGKPGPRPNAWKSGPDPLLHDKFTKWHKHRAQARFRGEPHSLTFEQWSQLWGEPGLWAARGTSASSLCLTMISPDKGWHWDNVEIVTREEQLIRHGQRRRGIKHCGKGTLNPRLRGRK